jgi:protoheme IX farnesyltransferase
MITTGFGYIAGADSIKFNLFYVLFGILLLACGSAVFNHYQERNIDILMERTKNRLIPSGRISKNNAFIIGAILVLLGSFILDLFHSGLVF